eukprot:TRINITY_DN1340_c0_g1_i1.p1 TRINITY_DN1340_c0_g1~~TRINITY_DN1340_c0_g1_i1.p1  ORF type:complete len:224 (-),score=11.43 TRINITY_DN1340_c0_g1_i1:70-741(-)
MENYKTPENNIFIQSVGTHEQVDFGLTNKQVNDLREEVAKWCSSPKNGEDLDRITTQIEWLDSLRKCFSSTSYAKSQGDYWKLEIDPARVILYNWLVVLFNFDQVLQSNASLREVFSDHIDSEWSAIKDSEAFTLSQTSTVNPLTSVTIECVPSKNFALKLSNNAEKLSVDFLDIFNRCRKLAFLIFVVFKDASGAQLVPTNNNVSIPPGVDPITAPKSPPRL